MNSAFSAYSAIVDGFQSGVTEQDYIMVIEQAIIRMMRVISVYLFICLCYFVINIINKKIAFSSKICWKLKNKS